MTQPAWADMIAGESLLDWLNRTDTDRVWAKDPVSGLVYTRLGADGTTEGNFTLTPMFTEAEWVAERDRALGILPLQAVAPVWPGLAKVTLGEPLALSNGLVVAGPLDGLIFAITRDSTGGGRWQFGEVSSWNNVGAVMFETDGGSFERAITIGIDTQVVVPLTMVRAAGAVVRFANPFSGTVTPWTITGT